MEALSNTTVVLTENTVNSCLKGLYAIMKPDWPRNTMGKDPELSKELIKVMHRTILTKESVQSQLLSVEVVKQILKAAQEKLEERCSELDSKTEADSDEFLAHLGEGGQSGTIVPGKSMVFATLEVCLCVISKHIPALNPSAPSTGFQVPTRLTKISDESCQLLASVITMMSELPNLCSPAGLYLYLVNVLHVECVK